MLENKQSQNVKIGIVGTGNCERRRLIDLIIKSIIKKSMEQKLKDKNNKINSFIEQSKTID